ncbi:hypothetical protein RB623_16855 [Mesorhizobium sp. LHD-90]|uniref:DUF6875 domain-containing protein n=1 Tax=Mesorhizobium sp. LHD-90 TaxID=3071414 RepID=UPI0027DF9A48|nr:hypothetical protein [Mesorhizobium sp. LHD-90]MDQ6435729.1 hypothetical protein [Mesorhizobium sp. LHD-90]
MLDKVMEPAVGTPLLTMTEARALEPGNGALAMLRGWVETYLMSSHPDLGRAGAVCPFTKQAAKLDLVRLAICEAGPKDEEAAFAVIRKGFADLEKIPCKPSLKIFRTVIVGFPNCGTPEGIDMLQRVQRRHKLYSLARFRMIGFMHAENDAPGLWNPEFRPLRAPLPVLAIRHLVEQDAPFAARHPLLMAPYLLRFPLAGPKRLLAYMRGG